MNKKIIISSIIIIAIIIVFVLFANPFPEKKVAKSFKQKINDATKIDLIINSPYDTSAYEVAKKIESKELKEYTDILSKIEVTENSDYNSDYDADKFYYTLVINTEDEEDKTSIYFQNQKIIVDGKTAKLDSDNIAIIDNMIAKEISGYGTLKCDSISPSKSVVEKYYFKNGKIYHYSKSQTYTPSDIKKIDDNISKINSYNGIDAMGNTLGDKNYSYIIDINLDLVSDDNFAEVTQMNKKEFVNKTKDDFIKEKNNMNCTFIFR